MPFFPRIAAAPEDVRRKIHEVVSRPEYDLTPPSTSGDWPGIEIPEYGSTPPGESGPNVLSRILEWVLQPFVSLIESLSVIHPALRFLLIGALVGVSLYLLLFIARLAIGFVRRRSERQPWNKANRLAPTADPTQLEREALALAARQDYIGGVRLLFKACVRRIELAEQRQFRSGITNREILRRYLQKPWGSDLAMLVKTIDYKWYGDEPCLPADFEACRLAQESVARGSGAIERA